MRGNMENKWEFDKNYIGVLLKDVDEQLNRRFISKNRRKYLEYDKKTFELFLKDDFSYWNSENPYSKEGMEVIISESIKKIKKLYKILGDDLISWLVELSQSKIFNYAESKDKNIISLDEQAELIIKNYERHSRCFLKDAKFLLNDGCQVQEVTEPKYISYCHDSEITRTPFIVINTNSGITGFNHEMQHAIEFYNYYYGHDLYGEVGPILLELLFLDVFSEEKGSLKSGDYDFRLYDTNKNLNEIVDFLFLMKYLAKRNFKVTNEEFLDVGEKLLGLSKDKLYHYLLKNVLDFSGVEENLMYTFSFLKAIELRQKILSTGKDVIDVLHPYISKYKFRFDFPEEAFDLYNDYVEEMNCKIRKR